MESSPNRSHLVWAVVPAAGQSSRIKQSLKENTGSSSKIFLPLEEGWTVLHQSLQQLWFAGIRSLCIPTRRDLIEEVRHLVKDVGDWDRVLVIEGGATRFESVKNALLEIKPHDPEVAVIHDAARPFCPVEVIQETITLALAGQGVIVGVPVTSTIKEVDDNGLVQRTPPREFLWEAQTPQSFPFIPLFSAFQEITEEKHGVLYDDASVFEEAGNLVKITMGTYSNIKITTPGDYELAKVLFKQNFSL
jgi:2-C-methyl-D-erythritol 4-phosphate cytidylyltransferase